MPDVWRRFHRLAVARLRQSARAQFVADPRPKNAGGS